LQLEDLTDLLRAEKKLAQSERKFIEFADMLPEIVFETDLQGRLLFVNRSGLELMGYTAEDLQRGVSAFDCVSPEDRPRAEANFREVLRGADLGVNEYTLVRRDGRTFTGLLRSRLLVEGGTPRGLRGFIIDVSERKQIEAALQDSELRLRLAVEAAQIGIYSTDLETDQRQWSPELYAIVGRAPGTILSEQEAWSIVHPEDQARVLETHRQALNPAGDGRFYSEHRIVRPDGEVRWIVWMGRTFFRETSNGRVPTRRIGACIDVTERKQAEDELMRSHKGLEQRVAERTAELTAANQRLKQQIEQRLVIEKKLRAREAELKNKTDELLEINTALKVLLKKRDEDQREAKEKIAAHLKRMVLPYLEKLMRSKLPSRSRAYAGMLASNLKDIASPFAKSLADNLYNLTPTELRVAGLIKLGQSSKEIAAELNLSPKTVEFHRYNIRRKLGLGKKRLNLQSFLKTMK
jgi:PAS domain S-box-containing protein